MPSDKTKKVIIDVASRLFEEKGFNTTTMDEIAAVAQKAKGSLYYHFKSKEELFAAVIDIELEKLRNHLKAIVDNKSMKAEDKIKMYFLTRMKILNDANCYKGALRLGMHTSNPHVRKVRETLEKAEKENLKRIIQQGISDGDFEDITRSIDIIMEVFIIVQKGLESPFFLQGHYQKFSLHLQDMINILIKGLRK